jgi:hypothetical protein
MDAFAILIERKQHLRALPEDIFGDIVSFDDVSRSHLLRAFEFERKVQDDGGEMSFLDSVEKREIKKGQI